MKRKGKLVHMSEETLLAMSRGEQVDRAYEEHVSACAHCKEEVNLYRGLVEVLGTGIPSEACPDSQALVSFEAGMLFSKKIGDSIERHLTRCEDCAVEYEALQRVSVEAAKIPVYVPRKAPSGESLGEKLRALVSWSM